MNEVQTIVWTALPNGTDPVTGNLRLSVFVAPRLSTTDGTVKVMKLQQFPDLRHWSAAIEKLSFTVQIKGGPTVQVKPDHSVVVSGLWDKLFNDNTPVKPFAMPPYSSRKLRSFPSKHITSNVRNLFVGMASTSPTDHPELQTGKNDNANSVLDGFMKKFGTLFMPVAGLGKTSGFQGDYKQSVYKQLDGLFDSSKSAGNGAPKVIDYDSALADTDKTPFMLAARFYDRPENKQTYGPIQSKLPKKSDLPDTDFHQMLTMLGDYPGVMRKLGIVFDIEIPKNGVPANGQIRVSPVWNGYAPSSFNKNQPQPYTVFEYGAAYFRARAADPLETKNGMLALNEKGRYELTQIDTDSAFFKTFHYAESMARMLYSGLYKTTEQDDEATEGTGAPTLRSGGITINHNNRAYRLAVNIASTTVLNAKFESSTDTLFYAEDLTRGYRIDVISKENPQWKTLCDREGYMTINGEKVLFDDSDPYDQHAYVKGPSGTSSDGKTGDLYIHETLFGWEGWSLVAARPGKTIEAETTLEEREVEEMQKYDHTRPKAYGMGAGNITEQKWQSKKVKKLVPVQEEKIKEIRNQSPASMGFTVETFVKAKKGTLPRLRFGHHYRMRARIVDLAGNSIPLESADTSAATNEEAYNRMEPVISPVLVQREAVREGESSEHLVIRSNYDKNTKQYSEDTQTKFKYSNGTPIIYNHVNDRHVAPPKTSQLMAELHGLFDKAIGLDKGVPAYDEWWNIAIREKGTFADLAGSPVVNDDGNLKSEVSGDTAILTNKQTNKQEVLHKEDQLKLPYLPDPISFGTALRGLPGVSGGGLTPDGLVKVELPGFNNPKPLNILKVPFDGTWPDALPFRIVIVEGSGEPKWDSSKRVLTVLLPKAADVKINLSSYFSDIFLKDLAEKPKSIPTAKSAPTLLDILGIWQWLSPDLRKKLEPYVVNGQHWMFTPFLKVRLTHAVQQPLKVPELKLTSKREDGWTYANLDGSLMLSVKSTGKLDLYADWKDAIDDPSDDKNNPEEIRYDGSAHPYELNIKKSFPDTYSILPSVPIRHEFGDTKYRKVNYYLVGTTRFPEYFPPEITSNTENITRNGKGEGKIQTIKILSTARPAAPVIQYLVPTFGWNPREEVPMQRILSRRCGGGVRVYMDRPWYSTGDEELLGVILEQNPPATTDDTDAMKPYVTRWGMDPIWGASPVDGIGPRVSDFTNRSSHAQAVRSNLELEESASKKVTVVGHDVHFDMDRKLWYSDINLDIGDSYFPFIRFALARYQPNSIENMDLSRVVLNDYIQMVPDRVAGVLFDTDQRILVSVAGIYGLNNFVRKPISPDVYEVPSMEEMAQNPAMVNYSRHLSIVLEVRDGGDWRPVTTQYLTPTAQAEQKMVWGAMLNLAEIQKSAGGSSPLPKFGEKNYRLLFQEYEWLPADQGIEYPVQSMGSYSFGGGKWAARLVYADTIEV